jgi:hypothetical protein
LPVCSPLADRLMWFIDRPIRPQQSTVTADFIVIGPIEVSSATTAFVAQDALVHAPVSAMRTNISAIRCEKVSAVVERHLRWL